MSTGLKLKCIFACGLALTMLVGWIHIKNITGAKARLAQTLATLEKENAGLRRELADNFEALRLREKHQAELAIQTEALINELNELYQNNEHCRVWADSPVPDDVLKRLRQ